MDPPMGKAPQQCDSVRVAVNVRPLITHELLMGCTDCVTVSPGEPQIQIGSHAFTYDHVYGSSGSPSSAIYDECVAPLVDALFHGYNATVLAYGQTGSGKTYTMGTNYTGDERSEGIIPKVMEHIFQKVESKKANTEFLIRVSFIEIFKEEVFDLLDPNHAASRGEGAVKTAGPARVPIQIRETVNGGITLAGVTEAEVCSKQEMASFLARGSLSRATASTNMNNQSSRSHAIFTVSMEMKSRNSGSGSVPEGDGDDILCAKLHLVDLAGSERAKRTGADGLRLKEGIHINRGLLALGNVISALGDEKKRKEGVHVPYRDSKLTRLLQDSLGGNSKTVMIACVSPADTNAEETINTLKYANRARNIQNKAVVNRDPMNAQMQKMRSQLEQLQAELLYFRGGGGSHDELQVLQHKIQLLETRNVELCQELNTRQLTCECLEKRAMEAQLEKDKLFLKLESFKNGRLWTENDDADNKQDFDLLKTYVSRIQDLEMKLLQMESVSNSRRNAFLDSLDLEDDGLQTRIDLPTVGDNSSCCEGVDDEKEMEHSTLQDKFGRELQELNKQLEQKEEEMKQISTLDTSVLRQHYEKKILDMEQEKKALQKEIEDLQGMLANLSLASDDGAQKLKQEYLKKLNALEAQVSELKKKQEAQSHTLRQKQRSEEAAKRLQEEIQRIKTQKVQLQHKIKQESEQFRLWKASREKEVLQLKKEGRRNEYEMHKLLALNQRQKMVLQRKTEEASLATKRLKELLEAKKTSRESSGPGTANGPGIQALIQAIEHELEVTVRVHEVRSQYGRQLEARSAMANELSKLKDEELLRQKNMSASHTLSPSARNSRIIALENMLATSSSTLVTMASQLSEAEERERVFAGRGRWNQVRSLPEAKSLMNFLSELASSSRCQLRDVEIASREKDSVIKELKEKILSLNLTVKQLEAQKAALVSLDKPKAPRKSTVFNTNVNNTDLEEDMDLSESEQSDQGCSEAESDEDWVDSRKRMPRKRSRLASRSTRSSADGFASECPKLEILDEAATQEVVGSVQKTCCSCSKYSLCKTKKCECRASNGFCGQLCGCLPSKCSNREGATNNESEETSPSESMEHSDCERTSSLAHQGALLLKSALSEKPTAKNEEREGTQGRMPLSDIGNKTANSTTAKPTKRKNWRKSVIQIVPVVQLPPNPPEAENNEPPRLRETLPLKLPRAMASVKNNNHPLAERNSMNSNNHAGSVRFTQDSDEKENDRA